MQWGWGTDALDGQGGSQVTALLVQTPDSEEETECLLWLCSILAGHSTSWHLTFLYWKRGIIVLVTLASYSYFSKLCKDSNDKVGDRTFKTITCHLQAKY